MSKRKPSRGQDSGEQAKPTPASFDRRLMEKQVAQIERLLASHEFESIEEAQAFLKEALTSGSLPEAPPSTPLEEAQEIVYQALETTGQRRVKLARQALEISPDCADAYVILAEGTGDPNKAGELYEQGVRAGERALGPQVFERDMGHFWGIVETRPYMRARQGLAEVLWHLGERRQAIEHYQDMLRLNPNDNQGLRYTLANWLLAKGDDEALGELLDQYPDEWSASWAYTRALYTFRRQGAGKQAHEALRQALEVNRFVPLYLLGVKKMPQRLPDFIGMGDENEAVSYIAEAVENWANSPGALEWFVDAVAREVAPEEHARLRGRRH